MPFSDTDWVLRWGRCSSHPSLSPLLSGPAGLPASAASTGRRRKSSPEGISRAALRANARRCTCTVLALLLSQAGSKVWWQTDDIADKLIANNAARPLPGMEKPDMSILTLNAVGKRDTSGARQAESAPPSREGNDTDSKSGFPERLAD